jgi:hypothetical protein
MRIPFSVEQFLEVFARFNEAIWPAQVAAYVLAVAVVVLAVSGGRAAGAIVPALLAATWLFVGAVYHLAFFAKVNPAARLFGALFIVQALLFAETASRRRLAFRFSPSLRAVVGLALVSYAAIMYPILGAALGHEYPRAPTFGVTPCPTTIFTFGVLLLSSGAVPRSLLVIPLAWSLVGASAAVQLGIREDLGLVVAGALGAMFLVRRTPPRGATRMPGVARPRSG